MTSCSRSRLLDRDLVEQRLLRRTARPRARTARSREDRSSSTTAGMPASTSAFTTWEPMYPAPPVTSQVMSGRSSGSVVGCGRSAYGHRGCRLRTNRCLDCADACSRPRRSTAVLLVRACRRGVGVRRTRRRRALRAAGRPDDRDRPGAPARQPPLPAEDPAAGAGRRVPEALQHDRHRHERRLRRGDLRLAGVDAAAGTARAARRHGRAHPAQQPRRTGGVRASTTADASATGPAPTSS